MSKKNANIIGYLYLVGMALALIGCFVPLSTSLGGYANGNSALTFITKGRNATVKVGCVLALVGAAAGVVLSFLRGIKNGGLCRLAALIVSVAGGLYLFLNINGKAFKFAAKVTGSHFGVGFWLIMAGWVVALVGWILNRE